MNKGLFGTLVMLFCITLVIGMASCESRSGKLATEKAKTMAIKPIKIKIVRFIKTDGLGTAARNMYKIETVPSDSMTHYMSANRYLEVGDIIMAKPGIDFN